MTSHDCITHEEIRQRAHALWERSNQPAGCAVDHWLAAENELRREREAMPEAAEAE